MAHPHAARRQTKVEHQRVAHITKGYASGGAVNDATELHPDEKADIKLVKKTVKKSALKMAGGAVKHRADKRARGGKVKHKGATINILNAPGHAMGGAPMAGMTPPGPPMAPPAMPPRPPMPPPAGAMPPGMPPGGGAPMPMPPRKHGGKTYARGGAVKDGPAWKEGLRAGTQVKNTPGKNDLGDLYRGRQITYKTGGKVEAPEGVAPATKLPGGAGGGKGRLAKERRAKKVYA